MKKMIFDIDTQENVSDDNSNEFRNTVNIINKAYYNGIAISGSVFYDENEVLIKHDDTIISEAGTYVVPNNRYGVDVSLFDSSDQVYFEKSTIDPWDIRYGQPDNIMTYLRYNKIESVYIIGHNHFGSLIDTVIGFLRYDISVYIVNDAISHTVSLVDDVDSSIDSLLLMDNVYNITSSECIDTLHQ